MERAQPRLRSPRRGGYFRAKNSPWYFRADGNQVTYNGTKVNRRRTHEPATVCRPRVPDGTRPITGARRALPVRQATSRCAGTTASSTTRSRRSTGPTRTSAATSLTLRTCRQHVQQVHGDALPHLPWRSVISAVPMGRDQSDFRTAPLRSTPGRSTPRRSRKQLQRPEHEPVVRALGRQADDERRHPLTTTGQSWKTGRTSSSTAARRRSRSQVAGCGNYRSTGYRRRPWELRKRPLQYTKNNVGFDVWRFMKGNRLASLRLQQPRPDPRRLRQGALEQAVVEYKNDAGNDFRPTQVPIPEVTRH
jgi:hypothetical protein